MKFKKDQQIVAVIIGLFVLAMILNQAGFLKFGGQSVVVSGSPSLSGGTDSVTACVTLRNSGSTTESGLLELQPVFGSLAIVQPQASCNPNNPQDVHRMYQLSAGESAQICLTSSGLSAGTYTMKLVHVNDCCYGHPAGFCSAKDPYGWGQNVGTAVVTGGGGDRCTSHASQACYGNNLYWYNSCGAKEGMSQQCTNTPETPFTGYCINANCAVPPPLCGNGVCDAGESNVNCDVDCPKEELPILLILIIGGGIVVLGGFYFLVIKK